MTPHRPGEFEGSEPEALRQELLRLGRQLKAWMPPGWGFALWMFTYGEGGNLMYLSSGTREDMVKAVKEFLAKMEGASDAHDWGPDDE